MRALGVLLKSKIVPVSRTIKFKNFKGLVHYDLNNFYLSLGWIMKERVWTLLLNMFLFAVTPIFILLLYKRLWRVIHIRFNSEGRTVDQIWVSMKQRNRGPIREQFRKPNLREDIIEPEHLTIIKHQINIQRTNQKVGRYYFDSSMDPRTLQ